MKKINNLTLQLTGILLIVVGTTIYAIHYDYKDFLQERYLTPASLLVALGIITFCIAFFGCCGAVRESTCMIMVVSNKFIYFVNEHDRYKLHNYLCKEEDSVSKSL